MAVKESKAFKKQRRINFLVTSVEHFRNRIKALKNEIRTLENNLIVLKELLKDARKGK